MGKHPKKSPVDPAIVDADEGEIAPAFSEEALALDFAERFAGELRYVAKWGKWLRYDGARWVFDDTRRTFSYARALCRAAANACNEKKARYIIASAKMRAAVVALAGEDYRLRATVDQWDTDPWLLNTPGGVVDLRTGRTRPHAIEDYMTKMTAVAPCGDCPKFKKFLLRTCDGDIEMLKYMQRLFGYSLTGVTTEQALFFLFGGGSNGKGVLTSTVRGILSSYHQTAAMDTFAASEHGERHPTDLAMLRGARLVTSTETEEGARWAESNIKALTGGDAIQARFMRQDFFEFLPQFKLMISGNHKPRLRAVNVAIRRRMNLLPFTVTISDEERDPNLVEKLKKEWPGILVWMVKGCLQWQRIGLKPPQKVINATEDYLDDEDTLGAFINEHCILDVNAEVSSAQLFETWKDWAGENNAYIGSAKMFAGWMGERGFAKTRDRAGNNNVFKGLKFANPFLETPHIVPQVKTPPRKVTQVRRVS
jgi:putative DNA primase/helicase